ncbi:hypothetical protein LUZ60_012819 [Juncus effusus]|nr:hypothetical protein LUZ60_012819 [Juncus effusus]
MASSSTNTIPTLIPMASTNTVPTLTPVPVYDSSVSQTTQHHNNNSIGPFFAVFIVILVLTLLSCIFGRVCSQEVEGPDSQYDCARLARRKCRCCNGCLPRRGIFRDAKSAVAAETDDKQTQLALPQP